MIDPRVDELLDDMVTKIVDYAYDECLHTLADPEWGPYQEEQFIDRVTELLKEKIG